MPQRPMSETIAAAARQIQSRWPDPERRLRHRQASERQLQLLGALGLLRPTLALAPAAAPALGRSPQR